MGIRILVIDDTVAIRTLISQHLTDEGYEVIEAENGQHALEFMELSPVSLIISDIMMPKMGGFEFIEKSRQLYPKIPIIVFSSKQDDVTRKMVTELGANGFLEKPANLQILSKLISSTISTSFKETSLIEPDFDISKGYRRVPFFCETYFQGEFISGSTITTSISRSGCSLQIYSVLPVGTLLHVKIRFYPGKVIDVTGTVCYSIPDSDVGIRFLDLDKESEQLIDAAVKTISKLDLFDLEYRDNTRKLIDEFVDKFEVPNQ